jgi:hypothetical protein
LKRFAEQHLVRLALALFVAAAAPSSFGQSLTTNGVWHYELVEGSFLEDDCPICDRVTIPQPMRGSFELTLQEDIAPFARYELRDISFLAGSAAGRQYRVKGSGAYEVFSEFAIIQTLTLQVQIDDGITNKLCFLTNAPGPVGRLWPMIEVAADQTNGTATQVYHLNLEAAPFRELWFSTVSGLTSGHWQPPTNHVSGGDFISSAGRVVKRNRELTANLGFMPTAPDLGLDAADILPGGEIVFSLAQDAFSETLGPIQHGDLLSDRGRIVQRNQDLLAAFLPQPAGADAGLDAVRVLGSGEIYFSIASNIFSAKLGTLLGRGDLLSNRGKIIKRNQELLARFAPAVSNKDYGLDAIYIWPSGEIWFSTEEGFADQQLRLFQPGDILSDQGRLVIRNLDLLAPFAPLEDLSDFGLDALFVVTDAIAPAPAPSFKRIGMEPQTGNIRLGWQGAGRVFQVERAGQVSGPYLPLGAIRPDLFFEDGGALMSRAQSFYRLRQW